MMNIVVIGASYLQLPLIRRARELGFSTHVFAWNEGAVALDECDQYYPLSITDIPAIAKVCDTLDPAGIVTIASDLAACTVHELAKRYDLVRNSDASITMTTHKARMREAFLSANLPSPSYKSFSATNIDYDGMIENLVFPLIVKPVDRSGSRGVTLVHDAVSLRMAMLAAMRESFSKEIVVERFITGVEASVESISWNGKHTILAITDKVTTGPPHFVELEHHQPSLLPDDVKARILDLIPAALDALDIRYGAAHSEVIIDTDGKVWLTEIGARMGGDFIGSHLVPLSTGYDYVGGVIDIATNTFNEAKTTKKGYAGVKFLNPKPSYVSHVRNNANVYPEIVEHALYLEPGMHCQPVIHSGARAGFFVYHSNSERFRPDVEDVFAISYSDSSTL